MATFIRRVFEGYRHVNDDLSDPRTQDFFLIGSPWMCLGILIFYFYFIFELGPSIMAKRQPFKMKRILQVYNISQIALCSYVFYKALILAWLSDYQFVCEPVDFSWNPKPLEIARMVWLYFMIKLFDLLDTVFFVLRKKQNQISFLHVYHHVGMVAGSWGATKFIPGGHFTFLGLVNSFVHIVMYSHYLAATMKIRTDWWKKYITQLQITQFLILFIQSILLFYKKVCEFPRWTGAVFIPQNLFMIVLFSEFYYKSYIKKPETNINKNGFAASEATNGKLKSQ